MDTPIRVEREITRDNFILYLENIDCTRRDIGYDDNLSRGENWRRVLVTIFTTSLTSGMAASKDRRE